MNALLLLAIMFAIGAIGVGYLGNDFVAAVQKYGVGAGDVPSPVVETDLILNIHRVGTPPSHDDFLIGCDFTSITVDLPAGTKLFCKAYSGIDIKTSFVVAEGMITLPNTVLAGTPIPIPIDMFSFPNSNDVDQIKNVAVLVQTPSA